ncbi:MAG TPA: PKD domain-containing protein, partial [Candidatus Binatia bacterium]
MKKGSAKKRQKRPTQTTNRTFAAATVIIVALFLLAPSVGAPVAADKCPLSHGYWKNHAEAWPRSSLVLGNAAKAAHTYSQSELLSLLSANSKSDASIILAHQLIAAKLNVANGSNPAPIASTLTTADNLLGAFPGKLPYDVKSNTATGKSMVAAGAILESYNTGQVANSCGTTTNTPPVANAGPDQTTFVQQLVTLDGKKSSDVDGDQLTFKWEFVTRPTGSNAVLQNPSSVNPTFTPDKFGDYVIQLIVNDGQADSLPDT